LDVAAFGPMLVFGALANELKDLCSTTKQILIWASSFSRIAGCSMSRF